MPVFIPIPSVYSKQIRFITKTVAKTGKAIVSTGYLHAAEALADGRGLLVEPRDPVGLARAALAILDDSQFKRELESRAYEYGKEMAWPNVGRRVLELTRELLAVPEVAKLEPEEVESTEVPLAHA